MLEGRSDYWRKLERLRLSRRRLLGGTLATAAGATGLALTGCAGEGEQDAAGATPAAGRPELEAVTTRGGVYRTFGLDAMALDTRDPHQTRFGPISNLHSAVFSKVLQYEDDYEQVMRPDLSAGPDGEPAMPEQPDEETYIIHVRPTAKFHDTPQIRENFPQVAGRPLTAEDIKYSIERQINPDSPQAALFYQKSQWENVDKIELTDDLTLKITTKGPVASFLHFLADSWNSIIPREVVDEAKDELNDDYRLVGSGPWILDQFETLQVVRYVRNPEWFAADDRPELGTGRPFLDVVEIQWSPESDSVQETAFKTKQVDSVTFVDHANLWRVAGERPQCFLTESPTTGGPSTPLLIDRPPYQDFRVRQAIGMAQDRQTLGEQAFPSPPDHPRFHLSSTIPWAVTRWALPYEEVINTPGYRFGPAEREEDLAEAKKLWEAAGGTDAIGTLKILFAGLPAWIPEKMLPQVKRQLEETLGARVETEVDGTGYTQVIACLVRNMEDAPTGTCGFVWTYDNGYLDPHDFLYTFYHTSGRRNSFRMSDPQVDAWLDNMKTEFDYERRREISFDIQRRIADHILPGYRYFNDIVRSVHWPYVKNTHAWGWYGRAYWYANMWLDQNDPEFAGQKA